MSMPGILLAFVLICSAATAAPAQDGGDAASRQPVDDYVFLEGAASDLLAATERLGDAVAKGETEMCAGFAMVHRMEARGWMLRGVGMTYVLLAFGGNLEDGSFAREALEGLSGDLPVRLGGLRALLDADERLLASFVNRVEEAEVREAAVECQRVIDGIRAEWPWDGTGSAP
jgi:hypothetical protein